MIEISVARGETAMLELVTLDDDWGGPSRSSGTSSERSERHRSHDVSRLSVGYVGATFDGYQSFLFLAYRWRSLSA